MDNLLYIGFISGCFGLKGELKVISDSNHLDKVFKINNYLYIDNNKYKIINYHMHKNYHLITFEGYDDINKCDNFIKKDVYVNKNDLNLKNDEYLYIELIGFKIVDEGEKIGVVDEILLNKNTTFIKSGNLIIPLNAIYFDRVDTSNQTIYVKNSKELCL